MLASGAHKLKTTYLGLQQQKCTEWSHQGFDHPLISKAACGEAQCCLQSLLHQSLTTKQSRSLSVYKVGLLRKTWQTKTKTEVEANGTGWFRALVLPRTLA